MNDIVNLYDSEVKTPDPGALGELSNLCLQMLTQQQEVQSIEEQLLEAKKILQDFRVSRIPGLMQELGISDLKLASGAHIFLQRVVSCRLKPLEKMKAFEWLEVHEFGAMVKHELSASFGRGEGELANKAALALITMGLQPSLTKDVHFQTLSAWARRQVEEGGVIPEDLFDLSIVNLAKIK
jgi:hypothetical protein